MSDRSMYALAGLCMAALAGLLASEGYALAGAVAVVYGAGLAGWGCVAQWLDGRRP